MEIVTKFFPEILPDNDQLYLQKLCAFLEAADELSTVQITKLSDGYHFRIAPSAPSYNQHIFQQILDFHNMYKIHVDLSKSIKSSGTVAFQIKL